MEGGGDGDGDRGEEEGEEEECVVRDVKVRLGWEMRAVMHCLWSGLVWCVQHQKTPTNIQPTLSRALISLFTLGAVLIVFRVRKSRRGYERNETRGIVPRHNIVTSSLPTSQRATANFKSQHKNILHCWKLPTMGRPGQNIVSLNL